MIIGIDPGTKVCGYCILYNNGEYKLSGVIKPEKTSVEIEDRMCYIYGYLRGLMRTYTSLMPSGPHYLIVEESFGNPNYRTSLQLSKFRGMVLSLGLDFLCSIMEPTPKQVKKAVLKGTATKEQVNYMVAQIFGIPKPKSLDESDAIAVAYWGYKEIQKQTMR